MTGEDIAFSTIIALLGVGGTVLGSSASIYGKTYPRTILAIGLTATLSAVTTMVYLSWSLDWRAPAPEPALALSPRDHSTGIRVGGAARLVMDKVTVRGFDQAVELDNKAEAYIFRSDLK